MKLWKESSRSSKSTTSFRRGLAATPQSAACEGRVYLRFVFALWLLLKTMWISQTYDVIDYYSPFMLLFEHCVMMSSYVTALYVNCWSWHVHGSHSVCLLKPGVTVALSKGPSAVVYSWWPLSLPRAVFWLPQRSFFAECLTSDTRQRMQCRVPLFDTRQSIFLFFFLYQPNFLWYVATLCTPDVQFWYNYKIVCYNY
jgi:hypothetical protein